MSFILCAFFSGSQKTQAIAGWPQCAPNCDLRSYLWNCWLRCHHHGCISFVPYDVGRSMTHPVPIRYTYCTEYWHRWHHVRQSYHRPHKFPILSRCLTVPHWHHRLECIRKIRCIWPPRRDCKMLRAGQRHEHCECVQRLLLIVWHLLLFRLCSHKLLFELRLTKVLCVHHTPKAIKWK